MKTYGVNRSNHTVDDYLSDGKINLTALLKCVDIQSAFRSKKKNLIKHLDAPEVVHKLIDILHSTNDIQILKNILGLFTSPNAVLLKYLSDDLRFSEHLLEVLDKTGRTQLYVIGIVMQILVRAFDSWDERLFYLFNISMKNYSRIALNLHLPAVFHFVSRLISKQHDVATFIWIVFMALMDDHGTGSKIPVSVNEKVVNNFTLTHLKPLQRLRALEVLCMYFNENNFDEDIYIAVSVAIPLMLQDSSDDLERSWVIRLGLNLEPSQALGYSVLSVINCFKSADILIQYCLLYVSEFNVVISNKSVECFVHRLLKKEPNNFVLIATTTMIRELLRIDPRNEELKTNLKNIVLYAYSTYNHLKSMIMESFKVDILSAIQGDIFDPENHNCANLIKKYKTDKLGSCTNINLIKEYDTKDKEISQNNSLLPHFDVRHLWRPTEYYNQMQKVFRSVDRLKHLRSKVLLVASKNNMNATAISAPNITPNSSKNNSSDNKANAEVAAPDTNVKKLSPLRKASVNKGQESDLKKPKYTEQKSTRTDNSFSFIDLPDDEETVRRPPNMIANRDLDDIFYDDYDDYDDFTKPLTEGESIREPIPDDDSRESVKSLPKRHNESARSHERLIISSHFFDSDDDDNIEIEETPGEFNPILHLNDDEIEYEYEEDYDMNSGNRDTHDTIGTATRANAVDNLEDKPSLNQSSTSEQKSLSLQLEVSQTSYAPIKRKKPIMHRKMLTIEVPEKINKLSLCPSTYHERADISQEYYNEKGFLEGSVNRNYSSGRIFYQYDDEALDDDDVVSEETHSIENVIPLFNYK